MEETETTKIETELTNDDITILEGMFRAYSSLIDDGLVCTTPNDLFYLAEKLGIEDCL